MRFRVQFTTRRKDPETGEPYRWYHGPFRSYEAATAAAELARKAARKARRPLEREVRVEILPFGLHAAPKRGRPWKDVDLPRARALFADGFSIRAAAERLKIPRSTLQDALRRNPPPRPAPEARGRKRRSNRTVRRRRKGTRS